MDCTPVVPVLFAELKPGHVGAGHSLAVVTRAQKNGTDQFFVFPGEAAKQDSHSAALFGGEGALDGFVKMLGGFQARQLSQPQPFGRLNVR